MEHSNALARAGKINEEANIKDQHSIVINASIEKIWDKLIDVQNWSSWNKQIGKVSGPARLAQDSSFLWSNSGKKASATVQLFRPPGELAWTGKSPWIKEIYVWSLETDENQTIVTLKASMEGKFIFLVHSHLKVYHALLSWLEALKTASEEEE